MRVVLSPVGPLGAAPPPDHVLASVRALGERFPSARLRSVLLTRAADLDARADPSGHTRVWLALEALQVTGSFKVRGALHALGRFVPRPACAEPTCSEHAPERGVPRPRVLAASAGNHAAGVAYAAHVLDLQATLVMPRNVPRIKRERVEAFGASVVLAPTDHYDDAEAFAMGLAKSENVPFVSPYDDVDVVLGNGGSLGFEIVNALGGVPETVIAPFGGGGLATGLAWALADESGHPLDSVRHVWGVQSEASPAMALSLEQGAAVERFASREETLAEGLEGGITQRAFARAKDAIGGVVVVPEADIAAAMAYAYKELGLVLEGSAAAALVPVLRGLPREVLANTTSRRAAAWPLSEDLSGSEPSPDSPKEVVVVLTGRNVDNERLEHALALTHDLDTPLARGAARGGE
jgi:threonine dehydratase